MIQFLQYYYNLFIFEGRRAGSLVTSTTFAPCPGSFSLRQAFGISLKKETKAIVEEIPTIRDFKIKKGGILAKITI